MEGDVRDTEKSIGTETVIRIYYMKKSVLINLMIEVIIN